ncbi:methyltransferase domain-containing protein [Cohnella soli]|uniref:Methyltransferase domain-containing protein n=1 Tax=Cohnella soli TaxID=425005 RepID=A0ABW0HNT7_9BACL
MKTSIVLVTHNQLQMTKRCLSSIRKHTKADTYEILVVDNASTDGTTQWLRTQTDVKCSERTTNEGFPAGCNIGAGMASGDAILFLNNDTVVTPRWMEQMTEALTSHPSVGAVGPLTNYAGYGQMIETSYRTMEEMQRYADLFNQSSPEHWEERMKLIGFCLLVSRSAWETVGPLDESFGIGNYEDDDWSFRARLAGYKLLLCRDTFIHHEGSASFKHDKAAYRKAMTENESLFYRKWGFHPAVSTNIREDLLRPLRLLKPGMSVLEIGCGCGSSLLELRNRRSEFRLFGYEKEEAQARVAALVAEKVWTDDDEIELPSGTRGFDVVILNDIMSNPIPVRRLLQAHKLLRPGGAFVSSVPNRLFADYAKAYLKPVNPVPKEAFLSMEEAQARFAESGFDEVGFEAIVSNDNRKPDIDALCQLTGESSREAFMTMYYVVTAIKKSAGANPATGTSTRVDRSVDDPAATVRSAVARPVLPASTSGSTSASASGEPPPPPTEPSERRQLPITQEDVAFTGERLVLSSAVAGSHPDVLAEHVYRYRLARSYCVGKAVLDAACGAGYGTRMLKDGGAAKVTGVDIDLPSVQLAERDYSGEGISFQQDDVLHLPFANESFDVVVSFETIEHVPDGAAWLREAARVLKPGGTLIVSTPNRDVTNPDRLFGQQVRNPYHAFEYSLGEFVGELAALYDIEALYGQTFFGPQGRVVPELADIADSVGDEKDMAGYNIAGGRTYAPAALSRMKNAKPLYVIAVCCKK